MKDESNILERSKRQFKNEKREVLNSLINFNRISEKIAEVARDKSFFSKKQFDYRYEPKFDEENLFDLNRKKDEIFYTLPTWYERENGGTTFSYSYIDVKTTIGEVVHKEISKRKGFIRWPKKIRVMISFSDIPFEINPEGKYWHQTEKIDKQAFMENCSNRRKDNCTFPCKWFQGCRHFDQLALDDYDARGFASLDGRGTNNFDRRLDKMDEKIKKNFFITQTDRIERTKLYRNHIYISEKSQLKKTFVQLFKGRVGPFSRFQITISAYFPREETTLDGVIERVNAARKKITYQDAIANQLFFPKGQKAINKFIPPELDPFYFYGENTSERRRFRAF